MAKKTLLYLVQQVLNDLDSDYVNSIDDSEEAQQVASIIQSCYEELIANRNWPHLKKLLQLEASGSTSKPNYMRIPENVKELVQIRYDAKKLGDTKLKYVDIKYLHPDEFLKKIGNRNSDLPTITLVTDFSGIPLQVVNNKAPEYWTSFDDEYVVFDSFDLAVDTTLKKSKVQTICYVEPDWEMTDDFIPDLPAEAFALLEAESKSTASLVIKQMANQKQEQKAGRQQRWLARKAWKAKGGVRFEDYGRKSRK